MDDGEFVLEASENLPVDMDAVLQPVKDGDESMAIDEEGRPRFAPSRDTVRSRLSTPSRNLGLTFIIGPCDPSRDPQDPRSTSPYDASETSLELNLPPNC